MTGWWIWAIQFSKVHGAISFFNKKSYSLYFPPTRLGTAAYRRHHRSFRQRSYNLWVFDWKMIGLCSRVEIWWLSIASQFIIISSGADPKGDAVIDQRLFNSSSHCWSRLFALRLLALVATLPTRQGGPGPVQFLRLYLALQSLAHRCNQYVPTNTFPI
jgi:hypothetical protein